MRTATAVHIGAAGRESVVATTYVSRRLPGRTRGRRRRRRGRRGVRVFGPRLSRFRVHVAFRGPVVVLRAIRRGTIVRRDVSAILLCVALHVDDGGLGLRSRRLSLRKGTRNGEGEDESENQRKTLKHRQLLWGIQPEVYAQVEKCSSVISSRSKSDLKLAAAANVRYRG
jgi:hypothetical protein